MDYKKTQEAIRYLLEDQSSGLSDVERQSLQAITDPKTQGSSKSYQSTLSNALGNQFQQAIEPHEMNQVALLKQNIPGLFQNQKQSHKFLKDYRDGIGAVLGGVAKAPQIFADFTAGEKAMAANAGEKYAGIYQKPEAYKLAMNAIDKAPGALQAGFMDANTELQSIKALLGNRATVNRKGSQQGTGTFKEGDLAKSQGMSPSSAARINLADEKMDRQADKDNDALYDKSRTNLNPIMGVAGLISKYPPDQIPGLGRVAGGLGSAFVQVTETDPQRKLDAAKMAQFHKELANLTKKDIDGARATDQDFKNTMDQLGRGFNRDPVMFVNAVKKLVRWKKESLKFKMDNLSDRRIRRLDRSGTRQKIMEPWNNIKFDYQKPKKRKGSKLDAMDNVFDAMGG